MYKIYKCNLFGIHGTNEFVLASTWNIESNIYDEIAFISVVSKSFPNVNDFGCECVFAHTSLY